MGHSAEQAAIEADNRLATFRLVIPFYGTKRLELLHQATNDVLEQKAKQLKDQIAKGSSAINNAVEKSKDLFNASGMVNITANKQTHKIRTH